MNSCRSMRGFTKKRRIRAIFALVLVVTLLFILHAWAAEMVSNGVFNGSTGWSFSTATYDSTTTRTVGSGSAKLAAAGKNASATGTVTQSVAIPAGSTINTVALYSQLTTNFEATGDSITVALRYADLTQATILSTGELTNSTWTLRSASPALTLAQDVDQIIITMNTRAGNSTAATASLWVDEVSISYSAAALPTTTVADGTNPSGGTICVGTADQAIDTFTLNETTGNGASTVSAVQITFSDYTDVATVYVKSSDGVTTYGSGAPTGNVYALTLGTSIPVAASSSTSYRLYVNTASGGSGTLTARITDITVTGTKGSVNDATSATFAFNTTPPALVTTFVATSGQALQVPLAWTNPADTDLSEVLVKRKTGSYPTGHADAAAVTVYDDTSAVSGATVNTTDASGPPAGGTTYYYGVYTKDTCGNWNDATTAGQNAATATPVAANNNTTTGAMTFPGVSDSTITVQVAFSGDSNANNGCVVKWGTTSGGPYPNTAPAPTRGAGSYTTTVGGLSPSTPYYFQATFSETLPDVVSGTNPVIGTQATSANQSSLIHNSANTSTTYGTWGTGYGCATCHASSTTNIKRVDTSIDSPIGPRPVTFTRITSTTLDTGILGDDNRSTDAQRSQNICEVCHHKTLYHQYSASKILTENKNHKGSNRKDCLSCHKHGQGFNASCSGCHGDPPTSAATLVFSPGVTNALGSTPPADGGAHAAHTGAPRSMGCYACHNGYNEAQMGNSRIEMGFAVNGTNVPGFKGSQTTGSLILSNALLNGYSWSSTNSPGTTITTAASTATCNVYCHGNWSGSGGGSDPSWIGGAAEKACGACHSVSQATPPTAGNHARHTGSATASGQLNIACADCHGTQPTDNRHVNGNVVTKLNTTSVKFGSSATYKGFANQSSVPFSYGNCANVYCHSNVQNSTGTGGPTSYGTPAWGGGALTCAASSCHDNPPANNAHALHTGTPYNYACTACHAGSGANTALHANYVIDMVIGTSYGTTATYSQGSVTPGSGGFGTCNNTICHGTNSATWSVPTSNHVCTKCHGQPSATVTGVSDPKIAPGGAGVDTAGHSAANDPRVGAHQTHLLGTNAYTNAVACNECHVLPSAATQAGVLTAGHLNYTTATITFGTLAKTNSATPTYGADTCTATYCHGGKMPNGSASGTDMSPTWNTTNYLSGTPNKTGDCAVCHGCPPTDYTGTSHSGSETLAQCNGCHNHVNTNGTFTAGANRALHMNGSVEAQGGDCLGCHTGIKGVRRAIVPELGTSSTYNSHHVTSGTLTKWHCIICHAEGDTTTGNTITGYHNPSSGAPVLLRNVDSPGNPGTAGTNYWSIPSTKTAAAYANIDTFCMKCHDSNGANGIAMNTTGDGLQVATGPTNKLKPFNDNMTNGYDQVARTIVTNVYDQFATTNASHHAVRGKKYTTGTYLKTAGKFNTVNTLEGPAVTDTSLMHCHDCHYLNGHGTANAEYMLQDSSGTDTLAINTSQVCLKCHLSTYENNTAHTAGSKSDFATTTGSTGLSARTTGNGNMTGISCAACHNVGATGWGGIHGGNNTYTDGGNVTQTTYRFMPGMANSRYQPAGWTTTNATITCYTVSNTSWTSCNQHSSGKTATIPRPARPLSY